MEMFNYKQIYSLTFILTLKFIDIFIDIKTNERESHGPLVDCNEGEDILICSQSMIRNRIN